ncbi:uncharacterized mitochondrial protein-like protein [Tanacetum coccineum]
MASEQFSSGPRPQLLTPGTISSGLVSNPPSPTPYVPPTKKDWDILFQLMFDEYFNPPPNVTSPVVAPEPADSTSKSSITTIDQDTLSPSTSQTPQETLSPAIPSSVEEHFHDIEVGHLDNDPFFGVPIPEPNSEESSSRDVIPTNNYKEALKEACWIEAMHEELNESNDLKGVFLNQSKYALEIIKKYGMETSNPVDTLMVEKSKLDADPQGKEVDPTRYHRMISSLMYLTSSRPDLVFAV